MLNSNSDSQAVIAPVFSGPGNDKDRLEWFMASLDREGRFSRSCCKEWRPIKQIGTPFYCGPLLLFVISCLGLVANGEVTYVFLIL